MTGDNFRGRTAKALKDQQLRANFRRAMSGLREKRAIQFSHTREWTRLRTLGESIRKRALEKLPELLELLERNCTGNGIRVHWAETVEEANAIMLGILEKAGAKTVVKGKSMVSEETGLNHFLENRGIEVLESDLGEYIIQLAHEMPSHIIMPAIHKNIKQIAELFRDSIDNAPYVEDAKKLCELARQELRGKFMNADAGITGVNLTVAETGTLVLVENEGNGRMSSTCPPLQIAITGIEKVVEKLEDAAPILDLLPRSATGQPITTYVNMISSPRKEGEADGPEEVHLVLLDNGRTRIYHDPELRQTLQCIRCGACMNHCPVYERVGGHAYDAVYPGPIGKILTPQLIGLEDKADLAFGSTLCNACVKVCPVKIPIVDVLLRLRAEAVEKDLFSPVMGAGSKRSVIGAASWNIWAKSHSSKGTYKALSALLSSTGNLAPGGLPPLQNWTSIRSMPRFAPESLHTLTKKEGLKDE